MWEKRTDGPTRAFRNTRIGLLLLFLLVHGGGTCGPGKINKERSIGKDRLNFKERFPNLHEWSEGASGSYKSAVRRGSPKYRALKVEINTDVIFKEDGETNDNKRMTPRCAEKLQNLISQVRKTWHGSVKVRVIRAYEGKRRKRGHLALHYEGRAIDIQTSDMDRRKYPELGRLAINAGFDWVEYSNRNYIHASVKDTGPDAQEQNSRNGCFHSNSSVRLQNGKTVMMQDLKIGDRVASLDDQGNIIYSPVIMFFHRNPSLTSKFLIINTANHNKSLLITPTHLMYMINQQTQQDGVVFANQLAAGDHLYVRDTSNSVGIQRVTSMITRDLTGVYAPLTETGNILVDDILVSCYAVFASDTISHWTMLPVRVLAKFFPNFFDTEEEVPWYPRMLFKFYSSVQYWIRKL